MKTETVLPAASVFRLRVRKRSVRAARLLVFAGKVWFNKERKLRQKRSIAMTIAVIGAGASGMMAALTAAP